MDVEQFVLFEVLFGIVISVLLFFTFYQNFSAVLPVGCNNNDILENQFTSAQYGYPNRLEGTPLFRCYGTNACYNQSSAYQTCLSNECYYLNWHNGQGSYSAVQNCIAAPPQTVLSACRVVSPSNTADLFSCYQSTVIANNATMIGNCDMSSPVCVKGDSPQCPPCIGQ